MENHWCMGSIFWKQFHMLLMCLAASIEKWRYDCGWRCVELWAQPGMSTRHIVHPGHQLYFTIVMLHCSGYSGSNDAIQGNVWRACSFAYRTAKLLVEGASRCCIIVVIDLWYGDRVVWVYGLFGHFGKRPIAIDPFVLPNHLVAWQRLLILRETS